MRKAVGAALMTTDHQLIFQHRDNKPGIAYPDKLNLFGGGAEEGEDDLATLYRELEEETELTAKQLGQPEKLLEYMETKESNGFIDTSVVIYLFRNVDPSMLVVHEGQGAKLVPLAADPDAFNLTPLANTVIMAVRKRIS